MEIINMKVNEYKVMDDAVQNGIEYGWNRAHKHTDTPSEDVIKNEIREAIMLMICENFKFEDFYKEDK
jgi:hypothetical protein